MGNVKNFQDLVAKVTMYLDNELSPTAERELLREIKSNPEYVSVLRACLEHYFPVNQYLMNLALKIMAHLSR
ncbi:MAG: hypothetical protein AAF806_21050 [Bacteroidota bacterium]